MRKRKGGIGEGAVTGVETCALPILAVGHDALFLDAVTRHNCLHQRLGKEQPLRPPPAPAPLQNTIYTSLLPPPRPRQPPGAGQPPVAPVGGGGGGGRPPGYVRARG